MAEIIEGWERFAPREADEFLSGDVVEPGVYIDIADGAIVTLRQTDELPSEVRVMRFPRRFRRLATETTAGQTEVMQEALRHAA